VEYLKSCKDVDVAELDRSSGVGVNLSLDEIQQLVTVFVASHKESLLEGRYRYVPQLYKAVREHALLKWADGKLTKDQIDSQCLALLGPKDERDVVQKKVAYSSCDVC
jgi:glutaminyl-tRNA synthetase